MSDFDTILIDANRIWTPVVLQEITGHMPRAYLAADRLHVDLHFSGVDMPQIFQIADKTKSQICRNTRYTLLSDGAVFSVPAPSFYARFSALTPQS